MAKRGATDPKGTPARKPNYRFQQLLRSANKHGLSGPETAVLLALDKREHATGYVELALAYGGLEDGPCEECGCEQRRRYIRRRNSRRGRRGTWSCRECGHSNASVRDRSRDLTELANLSRTSCKKATQALRTRGWVNVHNGDLSNPKPGRGHANVYVAKVAAEVVTIPVSAEEYEQAIRNWKREQRLRNEQGYEPIPELGRWWIETQGRWPAGRPPPPKGKRVVLEVR